MTIYLRSINRALKACGLVLTVILYTDANAPTALRIERYSAFLKRSGGYTTMARWYDTRLQAILTFIAVAIFALAGLYFGTPPETFAANTFGDVLRAFARTDQTRTIVAAILIDVVTGVMAALRVGTFEGQKTAKFMSTNVVPYVLGYMLFWLLTQFGLIGLIGDGLTSAIASTGYGAVMATLTASIVDNVARARVGTSQPEEARLTTLPPNDAHG